MNKENFAASQAFKKAPSFQRWILASRPKTLSIAFVPLLVGTALAVKQTAHFNWILVLSSFLSIPWIQIGMNFINDALDIRKGEKVIEKLGLQRAKLLSPQQFLIGGYISFALSLLLGIPLMLAGGWPFIVLYLLSIACGYLYTGGPFPFSYLGIGNIFILVFYGWVGTGAIYYLETGMVNVAILLAGAQLGCLAIVPHAINNLRDHREDALVQKKTLAVRFGAHFARWEITLLSLIPFFLNPLWLLIGSLWMMILPFFALPMILRNLLSIWQTDPSPLYNQFLAKSAVCQLLFGLLLTIGIFLT